MGKKNKVTFLEQSDGPITISLNFKYFNVDWEIFIDNLFFLKNCTWESISISMYIYV